MSWEVKGSQHLSTHLEIHFIQSLHPIPGSFHQGVLFQLFKFTAVSSLLSSPGPKCILLSRYSFIFVLYEFQMSNIKDYKLLNLIRKVILHHL